LVHKQDKKNKIIDQSEPVEIQGISDKKDENLKISIKENELKNKKSYSLLYYIITTSFFSLLFFGIIYLIISKYRNRRNH
jgi:capsule polysaccharide export protein KpsE/RkpR